MVDHLVVSPRMCIAPLKNFFFEMELDYVVAIEGEHWCSDKVVVL
jgi:hypothetical protein